MKTHWDPKWEHFEYRYPDHWIFYGDVKSAYPEGKSWMFNEYSRQHRLLGTLRKVWEKVTFQGKRNRRSVVGKKSHVSAAQNYSYGRSAETSQSDNSSIARGARRR